jgi:hypothetical protein
MASLKKQVIYKNSKVSILFFALVIMVFSLFYTHNVKAYLNHCLNSSDLGIYAQGIFELNFKNLNPFVTVRGIAIFNDHFDPIIFLAKLFLTLTDHKIEMLILFELLICLLTILFFYYQSLQSCVHKDLSYKRKILYVVYLSCLILLSKPLWNAVLYPVHPTTWSFLITMMLGHYLVKESDSKIFILSILLMLCKEEFPFAILMLGFSSLLLKRTKIGIILCFCSCLFIVFNFFVRPSVMGPVYSHGEGLLQLLFGNPYNAIFEIIKGFNFSVIKTYLIMVLIFVIIFKNSRINKKDSSLLLMSVSFLLPLVLIRMLGKAYHFHYGVPLLGFIFGLLSAYPERLYALYSRRPIAILLIIFSLATILSSIKKITQLLFLNQSSKCTIYEGKKLLVKDLILKMNNKSKILATGGAVPRLIERGRQIFHYGGLAITQPTYDLLFFEKNQSGDIWPLKNQNVLQAISKCRPYAKKILIDNEEFYVAEGLFPAHCLFPLVI